MGSLILYFFLLVLRVPFNLCPDLSHKRGRFSTTLSKTSLKFVPSKKDNTVVFNLSFVLLLLDLNPNGKKQGRKGDAFWACGTGCIKMVFTLLTEIVVFHMKIFIIQVEVPSLEGVIVEYKVCLKPTIFLALDK